MSNYKVDPQVRPESLVRKIEDDLYDTAGILRRSTVISGILTSAEIVSVDNSTFTVLSGSEVQSILEEIDVQLQNIPADSLDIAVDDSAFTVITGTNVYETLLSIDQNLVALTNSMNIIDINVVTTTGYTLQASDMSNQIDLDNSSPITLTIPANSSVTLPVGSQYMIRQLGDGAVTMTSGVGVVIQSAANEYTTTEKYSMFSLVKVDTDTWSAVGDLS